MLKWGILLVVLAGVGYAVFDSNRQGLFTRPEIPEGAFSVSYPSGLRGIVIGVPNEKDTRRYLGLPMDVPHYLKYVWTYCHPPTDEESYYGDQFMEERNLPGLRIDAVCKIDVDDDLVVRGLIASTPRL